MEPHSNLKLLLISLCLVISVNAARSRLAPDVSPTPQPVASPSPSPSLDFSLETVDLFPIADSPSESNITIQKDTDADADEEAEPDSPSAPNKKSLGINFSAALHSVSVDPQVKKICDQTDHSSLCLATVLPLMKDEPKVESVLQVAVQAGNEFAKQALSEAKKLVSKPGTPDDLLSTLKDCQDGYDTAVENFQKTIDAFAVQDVGTMRSMLSAVITFVGDCQDEFKEMQIDSPLTAYAEKLTEMTSNCLAISSLMN